jgi:hypothetical protein
LSDSSGKTFPVEEFYLEDAFEKTGYVLEENSEYAASQKNKLDYFF